MLSRSRSFLFRCCLAESVCLFIAQSEEEEPAPRPIKGKRGKGGKPGSLGSFVPLSCPDIIHSSYSCKEAAAALGSLGRRI
jgi:hypothetical protein